MDSIRLWKWLAFSWAVTIILFLTAVGCREPQGKESEMDITQTTDKVQYALKFVKGQSYNIRIFTDQDGGGSQVEEDREISVQKSIGLGYQFDVNSVDDQGNAQIICTVNWCKYRQKVQGGIPEDQGIDYDSSDKNKQIPEGEGYGEFAFVTAKMYRALLGEKFTVTITPCGQVQKIGEMDTLKEHMAKKSAVRLEKGESDSGEKYIYGLITSLKNEVNEVQVTQFLKERILLLYPMAIYPNQPVSIGDSWIRKEEIGQGYERETKLTLKDRKAGIAMVEVDGTIQVPKKEIKQMSWRFGGQIEINESTGLILHSKIKEKMSWEMSSESQYKIQVTTFEMTERKLATDGY